MVIRRAVMVPVGAERRWLFDADGEADVLVWRPEELKQYSLVKSMEATRSLEWKSRVEFCGRL